MPPSIIRGALLLFVALALSGCGGEANPGAGEHFTAANWWQLASEPEKHKGATAEIVGRVFTEPERDDKETLWQMWGQASLPLKMGRVAYGHRHESRLQRRGRTRCAGRADT